ncbi:MAG: C10 family peptidase [Bacteroidia bacterium]|nr:C10 family peptidase [Bacteroidia bacterium]
MATTWNQTCFYNDSCPTVSSGGSCGRAYTGCNATAMGQICKYYAWPVNGLGSHCNTNLPSQCVNFTAQTYNYAAMPNNVTAANSEVAKLLYHLGAACNMQYSGVSSNSFFDAAVLKRYFAYTPAMYSSAVFLFNTTQELIDAIKLELDAGRPVYCKGGNHFYLIDGYNALDQFHINFGWSGTYDGYYPINSVVTPAGTFTPSNFIFMIRPLQGQLETGTDTIVVTASAGATAFEFTSLLNWTMSSNVPWINTALSAGNPGYYAFADGNTFTPQVNNGGIRYGHILIQNANDIDTIVVMQEASPLGTNPDTLQYADIGGTQPAAITYFSWASWTISSPASWVSISPSSGTGNGTPAITCTMNPGNTIRSSYAVITAGAFSDTIQLVQAASLTTSISPATNHTTTIYPNPGNGIFVLRSVDLTTRKNITIYNLNGGLVFSTQLLPGETILNAGQLSAGIYLLKISENGLKEETHRLTILH